MRGENIALPNSLNPFEMCDKKYDSFFFFLTLTVLKVFFLQSYEFQGTPFLSAGIKNLKSASK